MGAFFFQAFTSGGLFTRIPDLQDMLSLSKAELGLALMGAPFGSFFMFVIASALIERMGVRHIFLWAIPITAVAIAMMPHATTLMVLAVIFALYGAAFSLTNITMNVEADRVEAATGSRVMNRCHGVWSGGFLLASLLGVAARGAGMSAALHFALILPMVLLAIALVYAPMQPSPERAHMGKAPPKPALFSAPTRAVFVLVCFGISAALIENGARSWSVIYMRDSFQSPDWIDTLSIPAFLLTMVLGRMFSDRIVARYGARATARAMLIMALFGLALIVFAPVLFIALIGFALLGLGICIIYPLMVSTAAQIGDRPASQNVASVTMIASLVMLIAPGLMGWIAETWGIRASFAILAPVLLLSLSLVRVIKTEA